MNNRLYNILTLVVGTILLSSIMWYNGFPVLNYDSGAYINNGYVNEIPWDRPVFYSYWIRIFSLNSNIFLPVIVQSLLLAYLLYTLSTLLFKINNIVYIVSIALLTLCSSLSWISCMLTPDIFTPICIVALMILLFLPNTKQRYFISSIFGISLLMHNANILIALIALSIYLLGLIWKKQLKEVISSILFMIIPIITACCMHGIMQFKQNKHFTLSNATGIFLTAKSAENGVLKKYLQNHCEDNQWKLCTYKDSMPNNFNTFLWDAQSPLQKTGGPLSEATELNALAKDLYIQYATDVCKNWLKDIYAQCKRLEIAEDVGSFLEGTNPYWKVEIHFPAQLSLYKNSRQCKKTLHIKWLQKAQKYILLSSTIIILFLGFFRPQTWHRYIFAGIACLFLSILISTFFTMVFSRFNVRVNFLLPFFAIIMGYKYIILVLWQNKKT